MSVRALRSLSPRGRIDAVVDAGTFAEFDAHRPSPWLGRYGIDARDDDGVVCGRAAIAGREALVAAQDEGFLAGSIGAMHGAKLQHVFDVAIAEHRPVLLLAASGGVRLHEANAAELAAARALRALLDARIAGIAVLALGAGDVFGGASVIASAATRLALLPGTRFGLSGPRVIETRLGKAGLDAGDHAAVQAIFGAEARAAAGVAELLADDADAVRAWFELGARDVEPLGRAVADAQARLAPPMSVPARVEMDGATLRVAAVQGAMTPGVTHAIDAALLEAAGRISRIVIEEDSSGHEVSLAAERLGISRFLAHHAAVLAYLRSTGIRIEGVLCGTGHSAAFFANALQADTLRALPGARVVAMEPEAIARVTGLEESALRALIEDDPLLGHPARHFAALGGLTLDGSVQASRAMSNSRGGFSG